MQKKQTIRNIFRRDVVYFVHYVYTNSMIKSLEHVLSKPIWFNTYILIDKMQGWVDKGIQTIGDMFNDEGHIYSLEHLKNVLHLKCDFLLFNRLKKRIQANIGTNQILADDSVRPRLPYILYNIEIVPRETNGQRN